MLNLFIIANVALDTTSRNQFMNNYIIYSAFTDESYITGALDKAQVKYDSLKITFMNDYGMEIAEDDIDESGEDLSRSISGITVSLQIDCNTDKLQSILDELVAETDGHFEIQ